MKVISPYAMREADRKAIEEFKVPGVVLMENAGREVAVAVKRIWNLDKKRSSNKVAIFCGKGNNGGDGFVAARHLANMGFDARVILLADPGEIKGDAAVNLKILFKMGLKTITVKCEDDLPGAASFCDGAFAVVDALFGTGLKGEVRGLARRAIELINSVNSHVIAVDIPSGICGETGKVLGAAVKAEETVTMALPKMGLVLYPGAAYVGKLTIADIGMPLEVIKSVKNEGELVDRETIAGFFKPVPPDAHKGTFGRVFILAGSRGMTGAAALSALAASRSGAGLVTLGVPEGLNDILEVKVTEVMTKPLPETPEKSFSMQALTEALDFAGKCDAVALGPGISTVEETKEFIKRFLLDCPVPVVVDADGLNALAGKPEIIAKVPAPVVITPHLGEMARLLSTSAELIQENRVKTAKNAAEQFKCTVLLKGARTLIAAPAGRLWINTSGNPGMATGGSGDVLTGMIAAFLARGMEPYEAAVAGAYIHGRAGDLAARVKGEVAMIAGDIIDFLPVAFKEIQMAT